MNAIVRANDRDVTSSALALLRAAPSNEEDQCKKAFAVLALEALLPGWEADAAWMKRVDEAFKKTGTIVSPAEAIHMPIVFGDSLATHEATQAEALRVRRLTVELAQKLNARLPGVAYRELAGAGLALIRSAQSAEDMDLAREVVDVMLKGAPDKIRSGNVQQHAQRLTDSVRDVLDEMGLGAEAVRLKSAGGSP